VVRLPASERFGAAKHKILAQKLQQALYGLATTIDKG